MLYTHASYELVYTPQHIVAFSERHESLNASLSVTEHMLSRALMTASGRRGCQLPCEQNTDYINAPMRIVN